MKNKYPLLLEAIKKSKNVNEFIYLIQQDFEKLYSELSQWEKSSPENIIKYKNTGWFGIAADYYELNKK